MSDWLVDRVGVVLELLCGRGECLEHCGPVSREPRMTVLLLPWGQSGFGIASRMLCAFIPVVLLALSVTA